MSDEVPKYWKPAWGEEQCVTIKTRGVRAVEIVGKMFLVRCPKLSCYD